MSDPVSLIGGVLGLASSAYQVSQAKKAQKEYLAHADPFYGNRKQYVTQLNDLMSDPSSIETDPYYNWLKSQGEESVNRNMAAGGFIDSGNRAAALDEQSQGLASNFFQNKYNQLSDLAGVKGVGIGSGADAAKVGYGIADAVTDDIGGVLDAYILGNQKAAPIEDKSTKAFS